MQGFLIDCDFLAKLMMAFVNTSGLPAKNPDPFQCFY